MMTFFFNSSWWITVAAAMALASIPSLLKSLRILPILLILGLWLAAVIFMAVQAGTVAALAGGAISLLWGALLMLLSLLFTGVRQMAKKRYG